MPSVGRLISCVLLVLVLLHQAVAHGVDVWVNATIYDNNLKHVSYSPDDIFCARWNDWKFWKFCAVWNGYWQSQVHYSQGRRVSMHRSLDHWLPSMSIKFEGSAIYLYGPPRGDLDAIPADYRVCLYDDHLVRTTDECYRAEVSKAYQAVEDVRDPVLIFAKDGLQDHKHQLVVSIADPLNETESYHGIQFSHAVYTIKRPTPWPVQEDHWKFKEVAMYATHPSLSYWPDKPVRSWRFWRAPTGWKSKTYVTEDQSIVPWRELSSRDEPDQEHWGVQAIVSGGAAALYGIPRAYITAVNNLGHVCVQIDLGYCEIVDMRDIYLNTKNEDKPVLLWRNDALDPFHVTEISVRLVKGLYGMKRARMFPFKAIHHYTLDTPNQTGEDGSRWNTECACKTPDHGIPLDSLEEPAQTPGRGLVLRPQTSENLDICPWNFVRVQESHRGAAAKVKFPTKTRREYHSPTFWAQLFAVALVAFASLVTVLRAGSDVTEGTQQILRCASSPQYPPSLPATPHIPPVVPEAPLSNPEVKSPQSPAQPKPTIVKPSEGDDGGRETPAHIPVVDQTNIPAPPVSSSPLPPSPENQNNYGPIPVFSTTPAEPTEDEVVGPTFTTSQTAQSPSGPSNLSASALDVQVATLLHQQQNTSDTMTKSAEESSGQGRLLSPDPAQGSSREQNSPLLPGSQTQDGAYIPELAEQSAERSEDISVPLQAAIQYGQSQPNATRNHGVFAQANSQPSKIGHGDPPQDTQLDYSKPLTYIGRSGTDAGDADSQQRDEQDHSARECDTNGETNNLGRHQDSEKGGDRNEGTEKRGGRGGGGKRKRNGRGRGRGGGKK